MFQLWDAESANLVGSYETEEAALHIVRSAIEKHGRGAIDFIVLLREDRPEQLVEIAEDVSLAERALAGTSPAV